MRLENGAGTTIPTGPIMADESSDYNRQLPPSASMLTPGGEPHHPPPHVASTQRGNPNWLQADTGRMPSARLLLCTYVIRMAACSDFFQSAAPSPLGSYVCREIEPLKKTTPPTSKCNSEPNQTATAADLDRDGRTLRSGCTFRPLSV